MLRRVLLFLLFLLVAGGEPLARRVKIVRDAYGVPHISGPTDAHVVFGLMVAQAEDNFWQIEEDYIRALGRAAEIHGPRQALGDLFYRAFEIERLAREEYSRMDAASRVLCDAFADGLNYYLKIHPQAKPRLIDRFEPWHILAYQYGTGSSAVAAGRFTREEIGAAFPEVKDWLALEAPAVVENDEGSNMWAVAPSRSASGRAMLLINPHVAFFGGGQRYEAHLRSGRDLQVSGFAILGTPYIRSGYTPRHGWSHTNNYADTVDVWREPATGAAEWKAELRVKTAKGLETRAVSLRKTRHGPVVAMRDGAPYSARIAGHDRGGQLEQRFAMARARNLAEFKAALGRRALTGSNTIYADGKGNIFYLHGNLVPKRNQGIDPSKALDGADPAADWQGYHELEDLPQFLNPASGYLMNCNSTPFGAAGAPPAEWDKRYPLYMVPEMDNMRAMNSRRLLESKPKFTFEEWAEMALDTSVYSAAADLKKLPEKPPSDLQPLVDVLKAWDRVSRIDSVAMTLYSLWAPRASKQGPVEALTEVRAQLEKQYGTWKIPYGDVVRLQRVHTSGTQEVFDDARPSLPVAGGPGTFGMLFVFNTRQPAGARRAYGFSGNSYIAVVEFGRRVNARSLLVFGQSADPASPHFFDQAKLYSEKRFKDARF